MANALRDVYETGFFDGSALACLCCRLVDSIAAIPILPLAALHSLKPMGRFLRAVACVIPLAPTGCGFPAGDDSSVEEGAGVVSEATPAAIEPGARVRMTDATAGSGIDFVHVSGDDDQRFILDTMGGGAAFFDYDADGYLDLYLVNGTRQIEPPPEATSRLYRNAMDDEGRRFEDVTTAAGVGGRGWGMGCAVADYDNDGDVDLYVTYWGPNKLYRNRGDGRFEEESVAAGVDHGGWGTSAAFGDLDADGLLDLYVANYLEFDLESPPNGGKPCTGFKGLQGFCGPMGLPGQPDLMYRNRGDGSFEDVSGRTGIDRYQLPALGVAFADLDDDGDQDIYVANDSEPNLLWRNDGDWTLREVATLAGVAYSEEGRAQAGMGVDFGDFDNDGDLDLYVTNFSDDVNTLYRNEGDDGFVDATAAATFGGSVRPLLGWSTAFFDADNDGWQDLFVATGHLYPQLEIHPTGLRYPQRNLLYWNHQGRYREAGPASGPGLAVTKVSRGAAFGDYDNDGDIDILVVNLNDVPTLLRNDGGNANAWLGLDLIGTDSNRDAIGARVLVTAGGRIQVKEVQRGYGYQSGHDARLLFGLGWIEQVDQVEIRWPSGRVQRLTDLGVRQYVKVQEGHAASPATYGGGEEGESAAPLSAWPAAPVDASPPSPPTLAATAEENFLRGVELNYQARYQEAVALLREAVRLRPDHAEAHYSLAVTLYSGLGRSRQALEVLEQAVRRDSSRAEVWHLLGTIRLSLDESARAVVDLERAARRAPRNWSIRNRLGVAHLRMQNTRRAVAAFEAAVAVAPYAPSPYSHLARLYDRMGRRELARTARLQFERWRPIHDRLDRGLDALKELPGDADLHFRVGRAYLMQGRLAEARAALHRALRLRPDHALAHYGLGGVLHQEDRLAEAAAAYRRAYDLDSTLVTALNDLGRVHQQAGDLQRAVEVLKEAVRRKPDLARAHLNLGRSLVQLGRREEAIKALERAADLDSTSRQTQVALRRLRKAE